MTLPAPATVRFILIRDFFSARREIHDETPGRSPAELVVAHWPASWDPVSQPALGLVINGTETKDWLYRTDGGDLVVVYVRAGAEAILGAGYAAWVYAAANIALAAIVSYGVSMLLAPSPPSIGDSRGSRAYRLDGPETDYSPGGVIPVIFGRFPVGGTVLSYVVRNTTRASNRSEVWLLLGLGEGPVAAIGNVDRELEGAQGASLPEMLWVNDASARSYDSVRVHSGRTALIEGEGSVSGIYSYHNPFSDSDALLGLGGGEDEDPDRREPVYYRDSMQCWTRFGTNEQTAIPGFNNREIGYAIEQSLRPRSAVAYTTKKAVDAFELGIGFDSGLIRIDSDGDAKRQEVEFKYRFRRNVAGVAWSAPTTVTIGAKTADAFVRYVHVEPGTRGVYQIEVERVSALGAGLTVSDESTLTSVTEIEYRDLRYPGQVLLALRMLATEGLAGGRPRVRTVVAGLLCTIWDGSDPDDAAAYSRAWTRNPFWIALECLRNTAWGLGGYLRFAQYTMQEWKDAADWADELVAEGLTTTLRSAAVAGQVEVTIDDATGWLPQDRVRFDAGVAGEETLIIHEIVTDGVPVPKVVFTTAFASNHASGGTIARYHARFRYDGVFDSGGSPWDAVQSIVGTARGRLYKLGNRIGLVLQRARPVVALWTDGNSADFVVTYRNWRKQPNHLIAEFFDEQQNWDVDTITETSQEATVDDADLSTYYAREEQRPDTIAMHGVTRIAQVRRELQHRLGVYRDVRLGGTLRTSATRGMQMRLGDVCSVAHATLADRSVSGKLAGALTSGGATFTIDRNLVLDSGITYAVEVKYQDAQGSSNVVTRQITSAAGTYDRGDVLAISGTWPQHIETRRPYAIGKQGEVSTTFEVVASRIDPAALRVVYELEQYVEALNAA